jgi:hypothetical protein
MKRTLLFMWLVVTACASIKKPVDTDVLTKHRQPYKIFGIGQWKTGYNILTLTDSVNQYFVVRVPTNAALKVGNLYCP